MIIDIEVRGEGNPLEEDSKIIVSGDLDLEFRPFKLPDGSYGGFLIFPESRSIVMVNWVEGIWRIRPVCDSMGGYVLHFHKDTGENFDRFEYSVVSDVVRFTPDHARVRRLTDLWRSGEVDFTKVLACLRWMFRRVDVESYFPELVYRVECERHVKKKGHRKVTFSDEIDALFELIPRRDKEWGRETSFLSR